MDGRADAETGAERTWLLDAATSISEALIVVDERLRIVYRNPAAERLIGAEDLSPDPSRWSDEHGIYRADEQTPFEAAELPLVRAARGFDPRDVALFVRNPRVPDGIHIFASATALRDATGNVRGAVCVCRDITPIRRREMQLREAERQKKAILDNIPDIAWLKDEQGRYQVVNQRFVEAAGKKHADEIIGSTDLDLWPRELAEAYRIQDAEVIRSGEHLRVEEPFLDAGGNRLWVETIRTRIVDDAGKVIGTTGIARDVTERKRIEDAMRSSKSELERRVLERTDELAKAQENLVRQERLAILGQLASGMAHQIRNPLAAIMNATYVLKRHLSPDQHQNVEDAIGIIHDEVRHANVIITSLLDYARVRTPNRHPASIVALIERVLASDGIPQNVRVVRQLPPTDAVIREIDVEQLQGAISSLVRNAIDAMPDGGELRVALEVADAEVIVAVSDTGPGISEQLRAHLFKPLHSTKPSGVGLGLVTARRIVEAHGGKIASVDVSTGARFEIRLPIG